MSHTITAKLNKAANKHQNQSGVTFFVSLGEKNYNFKTKANEWTNYEAALFAKDSQISFYEEALVEGSIIEVSGTGIIMDATDTNYKPKLIIQDAKLGFVHTGNQAPQQQQQYQAPAPQAQQQAQQQAPQQYQNQNGGGTGYAPPQQQAPQQQNDGWGMPAQTPMQNQ